jgi:hypothetical protein
LREPETGSAGKPPASLVPAAIVLNPTATGKAGSTLINPK